MVNQVGYNSAFVSDAMKYLQHTAVVEHKDNIVDDMKSSLSAAPLIGLPTVIGAKGNYKNAKLIADGITPTKTKFTQKIKNLGNIPSNTLEGVKDTYNGIKNGTTTFSSVANTFVNSNAQRVVSDLDNAIVSAQKAGQDTTKLLEQKKIVQEAIEKAGKEGTKVADDILKNADSVIDATKEVGKKGFFSKIGSAISSPFRWVGSKISGSKLVSTIKSTEKGAKILSKADDFLKVAKKGGMIFDLVIEGTMQLFGEVIPAFKNGGLDSGLKQVAKSGTQVAASVGGWAAGAKAGAAVGAAIGSIFPGAGTAIGGAIGGIVGGLLGSSLFTGIAKKITGKSENEKIQEEQAQEQAQLIANDTNSLQQLESAVAQEIQLDMQDGELSEDSQKMLEYINSGSLSTSNNSTSFGSLTSTNSLIATNANGSYDFTVPQDALPQVNFSGLTTNSANQYGFVEDAIV